MNRASIFERAGLLALGLTTALVTQGARADVTLPAIFGDHMVLQQKQGNKVWGWAEPGEEITVSIADETRTTKANGDGNWSVRFSPLPAGGPYTLTVAGKNTIKYDDVLVGEVWLCSGQSNMEMSVSGVNNGDLEALSADYPRIRLISVPQVGTQEPKKNFNGKWELCTPKTAAGFSAVGYFFGRQLAHTLDVPIGLIDDSWGGSAAEAWVRRDLLEKDERFKPLMERWEKIEKDAARLENLRKGPGQV